MSTVELREFMAAARAGKGGEVASKGDSSRKQKIIFLDVDGVLHPAERRERFFEKYSMECLRNIVVATGAQVVLSSNWRRSKIARRRVQKELSRINVELISYTRDLKRETIVARVKEILHWLDGMGPCQSWVAIDDMNLVDGFFVPPHIRRRMDRHFVRTDPRAGLTRKNVEEAIHILGLSIQPIPRPVSCRQGALEPPPPMQNHRQSIRFTNTSFAGVGKLLSFRSRSKRDVFTQMNFS
mmetsp:Transcript_6787/g.20600  ORF Transcript_6787/g.20600 Transcript_6787/m.20600 type:complete len:240 (-) Transcript_6787:101-820(-)